MSDILIQNTHGYFTAQMSKDNYLQGLNKKGPNIWLNFDNAGTNQYGECDEQDINQKWENNIFDYKTQEYFEHPSAGCIQEQPTRAGHFAGCRISFRGMGPNTYYNEPCTFTKEDLDLLGFGVQTSFNGVSWLYAFYFVNNSSEVEIIKDDNTNTIQIIVGLDKCDNGKILSQRIVKALSENTIIKNSSDLKEIFAHPSIDPDNPENEWAIGQDEIIFWNSEHFGIANGFEERTLKQSLKLSAVYNGPIIKDNSNFSLNDVDVNITYTIPGSTKEKTVKLKNDDYIINSTLVSKQNAINDSYCEFIITYKEELYGKTEPELFTTVLQVPILFFKKLEAQYTGPYIYIISNFNTDDVNVNIYYNNEEYNTTLKKHEYRFSTTSINKLGINTITITELFTGENHQTTIDIIGVRIILDINVEYIGLPVLVSENINVNDVVVTVDTVDENRENRMSLILKYDPNYITIKDNQITNEYLIKQDLRITHEGDNIFTVVYKDFVLEHNVDFTVNGKKKLIDFEASYIGSMKQINDKITKEEVKTKAVYQIDIDGTTESVELSVDDWEFYDAPIVSEFNKGKVKVIYNKIISYIQVPYNTIKTLRLRCWYEGVKIKVNKTFKPDDVVVIVYKPNGNWFRLKSGEFTINSTEITKEGWNWFTVTYISNEKKLEGEFAVYGYIPIEHIDKKFAVKYIENRIDYREIDYTEKFRPAFMLGDSLLISWNVFLSKVNELFLYGMYILTAPKISGLSNEYDEDWAVLCINKKTLKAEVLKTYLELKEDKTNGE